MSIQRSSSHFPSSSTCWKYDVFISFRGEDTRRSFTDHLHAALKRGAINVFKDDKKLEKGKFISPELSKAIEGSRISIIVFSRNYASSTWCLDELVKIVQCMKILKQIVLPIFYDVDPSIVRKQRGKFYKAFIKHEEAFRNDIERVQNWRTALKEVADLAGWDLKDRGEFEFIQDIVRDISNKLSSTTLSTLDDLVGIHSRLDELRSLMDPTSDAVLMIGIYGMGGIGKTTIATVVYELMRYEFEGSSFLADVREISKKSGLVILQNQLLCETLGETDIKIWNVYEGTKMIRNRLLHKKVLIVIDDVDNINQLNELVRKHDWFGSGSRIILTTRDQQLLANRVDAFYEVGELKDDDALQLFSSKAFKSHNPPKEYVELSKRVVKYACGLPLALEVLGSFLFSKTTNEWESALQRLGRESENEILDSLEISFSGLKETEKKIFLDVACFFKGEKRDRVVRILDGCGLYPDIGIRVLIDKCLLKISVDDEIRMHDLLQEMGKQIVQRESFEEPGNRSRLWEEADIIHVLTERTGTVRVEGIMLEKMEQLSLLAKVFSRMTKLRLLKIHNVQLLEGLQYLSNELRLLEWHGYPLRSFPSSFQLDKTVELKLPYSRIEELWIKIKPLKNLKVVNLSHSLNLEKTPDFTEVPNLEELILEGCTRLHEIHSSLLVHGKLILLNMKDCTNLTSLPSKIDMKSLKKFVLSGCLKLKKFPEIVQSIECLLELFLDKTSIKELPFPIELLKRLVLLSLEDCKNLISLPSNINCLKSLKTLNISGCSKLENVPENFGEVECLEKLDLSGTAITQPLSSIFLMKNLKELSLSGCKATSSNSWKSYFPFFLRSSDPIPLMLPSLWSLHSLTKLNLSYCNLREGSIPSDVGSLVSLKLLDLRGNNFVSLPGSINCLSNLNLLVLHDCKRLQSLDELPSSLNYVFLYNCESLETLSDALKSYQHINVDCMNCFKLLDYSCALPILEAGSIANFGKFVLPGCEIPKWFNHQSEGSSIRIKSHQNLKLKGFAACVVFCIKKAPPNLLVEIEFTSNLTSHLFNYKYLIAIENHCIQDVPDHLYLECQPTGPYNNLQHDFYEFKFESTPPQFIEVKRIAAHLIYEQVDELNHVMSDGSSSVSGNLIELHQDFVAPNMDVATTEQSLANYDGAESSDIDNSDESLM